MQIQPAIGFGNVTVPGTGYVQLPQIACDLIGIGKTAVDLRLALSSNPGANYLVLNTAASGNAASASPTIPTAGDSSNLWLANDSGSTAQTVGFLWIKKGIDPVFQAI
jgi:filamentous hemagglutinin family protein